MRPDELHREYIDVAHDAADCRSVSLGNSEGSPSEPLRMLDLRAASAGDDFLRPLSVLGLTLRYSTAAESHAPMLPTPSPTPDGIVTDYNYTNGIVTSSVVDAGGSSQEATA
jgi:hypothetical protein